MGGVLTIPNNDQSKFLDSNCYSVNLNVSVANVPQITINTSIYTGIYMLQNKTELPGWSIKL